MRSILIREHEITRINSEYTRNARDLGGISRSREHRAYDRYDHAIIAISIN